jgi:hypothetical protein
MSARACRACGCTDDRACPGGCSWVERDLCSACVPYETVRMLARCEHPATVPVRLVGAWRPSGRCDVAWCPMCGCLVDGATTVVPVLLSDAHDHFAGRAGAPPSKAPAAAASSCANASVVPKHEPVMWVAAGAFCRRCALPSSVEAWARSANPGSPPPASVCSCAQGPDLDAGAPARTVGQGAAMTRGKLKKAGGQGSARAPGIVPIHDKGYPVDESVHWHLYAPELDPGMRTTEIAEQVTCSVCKRQPGAVDSPKVRS